MQSKCATGLGGLDLISKDVLGATYVKCGDYPTREKGLSPKPGGRIAKTYEALEAGPKTGRALFSEGNWMPVRCRPMSEKTFKDHLRWMVKESRLHVLR